MNTNREDEQLRELVATKDKTIQDLERSLLDLRNRMQERTNNDLKEKQNLQKEVGRLKDMYLDLEGKYNLMISTKDKRFDDSERYRPMSASRGGNNSQNNLKESQGATAKESVAQSNNASNHASRIEKQPEEDQPKAVPEKKIPRVQQDQVKEAAYEIALRMRLKNFAWSDIDSKLFPEAARKRGTVTIKELEDSLRGDPFNVSNPEIVLLLARYLVEDNTEELLVLKRDRAAETNIVKSIFKKLIDSNSPPPITEEQENQIKGQVSEVITKYKESLKASLRMKDLKNSGFVSAGTLDSAFKDLALKLDDRQREYIRIRLFELSQDINNLEYKQMFKIFKNENLAKLRNATPATSAEKNALRASGDSSKDVKKKVHYQDQVKRQVEEDIQIDEDGDYDGVYEDDEEIIDYEEDQYQRVI
eukprot:TRINITY_DN8037_c0_g1_i1.p1 TRINITY_DN8037_c0_g1~~TRINITY_DN8037_c0_g1_i1.p1  ORF type:complete len:419 (+),score=145.14 TRINITY_DN8037_c0_g1_i1:3-1259(+)